MLSPKLTRARHVRQLADAFGLVLVVDPFMPPERAVSWAKVFEKTGQIFAAGVTIAPVTDETTYAVALHELGHRLSPLGSIRLTNRLVTVSDIRLQLEEEEAAWVWARANAWPTWTDVMESVAQMSLKRYYAVARVKLGRRKQP